MRPRTWIKLELARPAALAALTLSLLGAQSAHADTSVPRGRDPISVMDRDALAELRDRDVNAARAYEAAEATFSQGNYAAASAAFAALSQKVPEISLLARRECQSRMKLGPDQRSEAVAACRRAIEMQAAPMEMQALVAAMMMGEAKLPDSELAYAYRIAKRADAIDPGGALATSAVCEVALRASDRGLMERCAHDLPALVATSSEAERVLARYPWTVRLRPHLTLLLWGAAALIVLLGLMQAARKKLALARSVAAALTLALLGSTAHADGEPAPEATAEAPAPERHPFEVDPDDPSAALPTPEEAAQDPMRFGLMLMEMSGTADEYMQRKEYATAGRFFQAIARAVSDRAAGFAGICRAEAAQGHRDAALAACRDAAGREGIRVVDYELFFDTLLATEKDLSAEEVAEAREIADHVVAEAAELPTGQLMRCKLAVRVGDTALLGKCAQELERLAPKDPAIVPFTWAAAVARGDVAEARRSISRGKELALDEGVLARMEASTEKLGTPPWTWLVIAGGAALLLLVTLLARTRRSPSPA